MKTFCNSSCVCLTYPNRISLFALAANNASAILCSGNSLIRSCFLLIFIGLTSTTTLSSARLIFIIQNKDALAVPVNRLSPNMLKYRMLTAFVLLIIIFSMMWLLKPPVFSTVIAIFFIIGAAEWAGLIGIKSVAWRVGYVILVVLLLFAAYFMPPAPCLYAAFIVWLWAAAAVYSYQRGGGLL